MTESEPMNEHEFEQLAFANPWSDEPAFLAAMAQDPIRQALVDSLRQQDQLLLIEPPLALRDKLLDIPNQATASQPAAGSRRPAASNDRRWSHHWLPLAACLALALTVTFYFFPESSNDSFADNALAASEQKKSELQQAVLAHIYREESMLEPGNDSHFDLTTVNAHLAQIGMQLQSNEAIRTLEVTNLKDCVVAQNQSLHLVIRNTEGRPVSVLLIDSPPVDQEFPIDDARFHGFVMPTQRGNLVIISDRRPDPEARALQSLFAANVQ